MNGGRRTGRPGAASDRPNRHLPGRSLGRHIHVGRPLTETILVEFSVHRLRARSGICVDVHIVSLSSKPVIWRRMKVSEMTGKVPVKKAMRSGRLIFRL